MCHFIAKLFKTIGDLRFRSVDEKTLNNNFKRAFILKRMCLKFGVTKAKVFLNEALQLQGFYR